MAGILACHGLVPVQGPGVRGQLMYLFFVIAAQSEEGECLVLRSCQQRVPKCPFPFESQVLTALIIKIKHILNHRGMKNVKCKCKEL